VAETSSYTFTPTARRRRPCWPSSANTRWASPACTAGNSSTSTSRAQADRCRLNR
jgi:hypothetical protein